MKTKHMVRNFAAIGIAVLLAGQAMAEGRYTLAPGLRLACLDQEGPAGEFIPLTDPEDVRKMLVDIKERIGEEKMIRVMGRPALQSLAAYSTLDKKQIYANRFAAAAAVGAAVAVVDFLWEKYVGNGGKKSLGVPRDYFDQRQGMIDRTKSVEIRPGVNGPEALTPVVAPAVVGAVAYRAVEYSLHKVFGDGKIAREQLTKPRDFDLRENGIRQY